MNDGKVFRTGRRKPGWVGDEIIRLKSLMPDKGCRMIAASFNRLYAQKRQMTVGKTYVANVFAKHAYKIRVCRNRINHRPGKPGPTNRVWGLDLTGKTDETGDLQVIAGIIDHGSRSCMALAALKTKASIGILRVLLNAIERYGRPEIIRTDNESVLTSRLFRFALWWLGIRHQTIDPHCPWQNPRIERFFLTLKQKLNQLLVPNRDSLNHALDEFRLWYNHIRPHQSLDNRTPAEIWNGTDVYRRHSSKAYFFQAWDGLLTGYYLPT